jgi:tetratricopeptide (TPR) repeat protein
VIALRESGDHAGSLEVLDQMVAAMPDDVWARHQRGFTYHHYLEDYPRACEAYREVIQLMPNHPFAGDYLKECEAKARGL